MSAGVLFDVSISVLAIVLLFSLAASAINEFIADNLVNLRGKMLRKAILKLLEGKPGLTGSAEARADAFMAHPDIARLMNRGRLPSAIEPRRYAVTVLKLLGEREALQASAKTEIAALRDAALGLLGPNPAGAPETEIRAAIDRIASGTATFVDTVDLRLDALESEFNETMDRVSGWYLRRTKIMLFAIGLFLAVGANVDILGYTNRLLGDAEARERAATYALLLGERHMRDELETRLERTPEGAEPVSPDQPRLIDAELDTLVGALTGLEARAGWQCRDDLPQPASAWSPARLALVGCGDGAGLGLPSLTQLLGWIIIALSVTLGAQFWFDLFQRLVRLRTAGVTGGAAVEAAARQVS